MKIHRILEIQFDNLVDLQMSMPRTLPKFVIKKGTNCGGTKLTHHLITLLSHCAVPMTEREQNQDNQTYNGTCRLSMS